MLFRSPADFPPQRLEPERSGAPVWSSIPAHLDFGPTAAAARMRGQSLSLPRLTVTSSPLELGPCKFRGAGGGPAGAIRRPRDTPGDPLVSFPSLGKKLAQRAKPSPWNETLLKNGGRVRRPAPTTSQADHSRTGGRAATRGRPYGDPRPLPRHGGRGKPLPYGVNGETSPGRERAEKLTPASVSDTAPYSWPRRRPPPPAFRCRPQSLRRRPPRGPGR